MSGMFAVRFAVLTREPTSIKFPAILDDLISARCVILCAFFTEALVTANTSNTLAFHDRTSDLFEFRFESVLKLAEKKRWSKVQLAKFSILEHQMDPSSNFSSYRSTLKAAMWRSAGATDERQRIVVPFFSLLVKDLYFLNEGCSNKLPNGHINFEKFWQLAKQVTEFIAWKQVACPFEKNPRVIAFLQASPVLTENALALASFECEPPDNNPEKERYKALKSELNAQ
ncbi:Ras-GEF domain-containing member 1B-A [Melipona bicolor]|uniref:Ras-GEF domain-containing member 1B-A n=1 Tax=Melipona bicolor TaxID=60889 RepID=A0AA40GCH0_9HYME|nr:Ras-GEF domain-containing member 1B-A [Melipona bicolor]